MGSNMVWLRRAGNIVDSDRSLDDILGELASLVVDAMGADACVVYLAEPRSGDLVLRASLPPHAAGWHSLHNTVWPAGSASVVALSMDAHADVRFLRFPPPALERYQAFLSAPVVSGGEVIGVMNVLHRNPHRHAPDEVALVTVITERIGDAAVKAQEPLIAGGDNLELRFHLAAEENIRRAVEQCGYEPQSYLTLVSRYGGLEAARRLLAEPVSDDSLQLWARGRARLPTEALAQREEWKDLFSAEERTAARERCAAWVASAADAIVTQVLSRARTPRTSEPEDNVAWGE